MHGPFVKIDCIACILRCRKSERFRLVRYSQAAFSRSLSVLIARGILVVMLDCGYDYDDDDLKGR